MNCHSVMLSVCYDLIWFDKQSLYAAFSRTIGCWQLVYAPANSLDCWTPEWQMLIMLWRTLDKTYVGRNALGSIAVFNVKPRDYLWTPTLAGYIKSSSEYTGSLSSSKSSCVWLLITRLTSNCQVSYWWFAILVLWFVARDSVICSASAL